MRTCYCKDRANFTIVTKSLIFQETATMLLYFSDDKSEYADFSTIVCAKNQPQELNE
ncbi:hypothetical protein [Undibacterium rugosum]|uniref:Uncharacterized protein n=1 Tax=Undibacterium rugosum TaxID=2762291 RepID=A0A923I359_9BURK|nr:hypothetical protein [Undibacterium rugosum]MBC3935184.1 hypothetical protein [Undibacterium rugosum]MBR7777778.1 hypothetical protein [Undibacterium rugosum]